MLSFIPPLLCLATPLCVKGKAGVLLFLFLISSGFLITDPRPPGYIQAMQKKNTVKELLLLKRQTSEQVFQQGHEHDKTCFSFMVGLRFPCKCCNNSIIHMLVKNMWESGFYFSMYYFFINVYVTVFLVLLMGTDKLWVWGRSWAFLHFTDT